MDKIVFLAALLALTLAEDPRPADHSKRGAAKASPLNAIAANSQKPLQMEQLTYSYQQTPSQTPVYPAYSQDHQQPAAQPMFSFLPHQPQMIPYPVIAQQFSQPKYQLVAMKSANGHMHLTLIPQNLILNAHQFAQPAILQIAAAPYHPQPQSSAPTPTSSTQGAHSTPSTYTPQPQVHYVPQYQQPHYNFAPIAAQPSNMFSFGQQAPQLYNHFAPSQSSVYSPVGQQLLNYYQSNPQAKHQLLYGNQQQQQYHQGQANSYQSPVVGSEYQKVAPSPVQQSLASPKAEDINLNTNEYLQSESQFRPVPSYGSRVQPTYKHQ